MENTWKSEVWHQFRARELTPLHRDVLLWLPKFRGRGGLIFPSHETLAAKARCCVRTVQRALNAAAALGLVAWLERRKPAVWGTERTSNLYTLTGKNPGKQPTGQQGRVASQENLFFLTAAPDSTEARASLAKVRAERQKKAADEWHAARAVGRNQRGWA
jgi:helix-turn-helix protein